MNIAQVLRKYHTTVDQTDLKIVLGFIIKQSPEFIITYPEYKLSWWEMLRLKIALQRLKKNTPVNYIIGEKEFYGLRLEVTKNTLIPRPETEGLVELAKEIVSQITGPLNLYDIGTGSGNIIIALQKTLSREKDISFWASDISSSALKVAQKNFRTHRQRSVRFLKGDLLKPYFSKKIIKQETLPLTDKSKTNLIIANLPYLSEEIYHTASSKVKKYEPASALVAGKDGLDYYRKLLKELKEVAQKHTLPKTILLWEISPEQKISSAKMIKKFFPKAKLEYHRDLAGKWRVVVIFL